MSDGETNTAVLPDDPPSGSPIRQAGSTNGKQEPRVAEVEHPPAPMARHGDVITFQSKTRERVHDLAEVYTEKREVNAMLDLVPDMFPSDDHPRDIGRTFLEPACGAGNFLVAILDRKLAYVQHGTRYRSLATFEAAILTALSSVYGIDIDEENVGQSQGFLKADVAHHLTGQTNPGPVSDGFWPAVDAILATNIIRADTQADPQKIRFVEYRWQRKAGYVIREWSYLEEPDAQLDLFDAAADEPQQDAVPIHYGQLAENPGPVTRTRPRVGGEMCPGRN